ncbi:PHD-finger family protein [Tritrichomonas foetus]|uniref:PHD-finger family protein n=1 Tax=Tritrichomonas foetus TaxID=1144522 RepID=A0A1J4KWV4_9EUKA|nr:PHD-finger family protein [Tritrichomonas foetus]|eukprot:OHT15731.1 PHD-finger family protein [Tritrichomonas foetus]
MSMYLQSNQESITPFELKALAFADLIMAEANESPSASKIHEDEPNKSLPHYKTIRCICGDNQPTNRDLLPCPLCHCYLHRDCLDPVEISSANFKCQFCRLQLEGIDPFRELRSWIGAVDSELRSVHNLVTNAANYESQLYSSNMGNDYSMQNMRNRQGQVPLRNQLNRTVQDIVQRLSNITKL